MSRERILSTELATYVGQTITVKGWLYVLRELGSVNFLVVRDGWGFIQCVIDKSEVLRLRLLQVESIISVTGMVVAAKQAPGGYELHQCQITILEAISEQIPLEINYREIQAGLDTYLRHAQIGLRHPHQRALLRLSAGVMAGFRQTLLAAHFTEIQSPKLVASATEGGANVFAVDYFDKQAFLAQSPQLYKQMMVGVFERVFEVGPVFRAEPHNTSRHINQYTSLDVEFAFIEDHTMVMEMATTVIGGILRYLENHCQREIDLVKVVLPVIPDEIPVISFVDAQVLLLEKYGEDCQNEPDLAPQHERLLGQWARQSLDSDFLFVTGYPMIKRPFYTHPDPENIAFSNSFDLLFRGIELITGGQRLHRYADYLAALERKQMTTDGLEAYLETFRFGMPPHGGFAIGLERLVMQLTGVSNIKQVTLFPRDRQRLEP